MENELLKLALSQGVWAAMSIILIFYILKDQERRDQKQDERESKYQDIIDGLIKNTELLENIRIDVDTIKNKIFNLKS